MVIPALTWKWGAAQWESESTFGYPIRVAAGHECRHSVNLDLSTRVDWEICSGPLLRWARRSELELERVAWCRFLDAVELYACDAEGNALLSSPPRAIDDFEGRGGGADCQWGLHCRGSVCLLLPHTKTCARRTGNRRCRPTARSCLAPQHRFLRFVYIAPLHGLLAPCRRKCRFVPAASSDMTLAVALSHDVT